MAIGGVKGGGYSRRSSRRRSSHGTMSDINVTPLVDVMLVLLIVFMVAAPLMTTGVPIQLPKTAAKQLSAPTEPLTISIKADKTIYIQNTQIKSSELIAKLQAIKATGKNPDEQVMVRGDTGTDYGTIMEVMGLLNQAGYNKIGLVTSPKDGKS